MCSSCLKMWKYKEDRYEYNKKIKQDMAHNVSILFRSYD